MDKNFNVGFKDGRKRILLAKYIFCSINVSYNLLCFLTFTHILFDNFHYHARVLIIYELVISAIMAHYDLITALYANRLVGTDYKRYLWRFNYRPKVIMQLYDGSWQCPTIPRAMLRTEGNDRSFFSDTIFLWCSFNQPTQAQGYLSYNYGNFEGTFVTILIKGKREK